MKVIIQSVSFESDGSAEVAYYLPDTDVKAPGVARMVTLIVPRGAEYDDELDAILDASKYLVNDVLEDFDAMPSAFTETEPE